MENFQKIIKLISAECNQKIIDASSLLNYLNQVAPKFSNDFTIFLKKKSLDLINLDDKLYELAKVVKNKDYDLFLCAPEMQNTIEKFKKINDAYLSILNDFICEHREIDGAIEFSQNYKAIMNFVNNQWEQIQTQITIDLTQKINDIIIPTTSNLIILANATNFLKDRHYQNEIFLDLKLFETINSKLNQLNINKKILPAYDATYIEELARTQNSASPQNDLQNSEEEYYYLLNKIRNAILLDYYCEISGSANNDSTNYSVGILYDNLKRKTKEEKDYEHREGVNLLTEHEKELPIILNQSLYGTKEKDYTFDLV